MSLTNKMIVTGCLLLVLTGVVLTIHVQNEQPDVSDQLRLDVSVKHAAVTCNYYDSVEGTAVHFHRSMTAIKQFDQAPSRDAAQIIVERLKLLVAESQQQLISIDELKALEESSYFRGNRKPWDGIRAGVVSGIKRSEEMQAQWEDKVRALSD